jgi:alcohol dehydrogenase class IV
VGAFEITRTRHIRYGVGSTQRLAEDLDELGTSRVFLITSRTLAEQTPLISQYQQLLGDRVVGMSAVSRQHVPRSAVIATADEVRSAGADVLVSVGGGSQIDCAKGVALMVAEGITDPDECDRMRILYEPPDVTIPSIDNPTLPHVTISTTLSASEFTYFAGITDEKRQVKDLYADPKLSPAAVYLDPSVTQYTPDWLWASSGIRAVDHCVETFLSTAATPFTDGLALRALEILVHGLPHTTGDADALAERLECQWAAWMSAFGMTNVLLGLSHGIGHQLGARCNVAHGVTSAIMLPHVLDFNLPVTVSRQAILGQVFGASPNASEEAVAREGIQRLRDLVETLEIPSRLRDVGVTQADFPGIVKDAMEDMIVAANPRPASEQDILALLKSAF